MQYGEVMTMELGLWSAAITLAANLMGGGIVVLGPATPTTVTQLCSSGCVNVDVGNVKLWPNGCMEFSPGLQAPGPFVCSDVCGTDTDGYCIVNGTRGTK